MGTVVALVRGLAEMWMISGLAENQFRHPMSPPQAEGLSVPTRKSPR